MTRKSNQVLAVVLGIAMVAATTEASAEVKSRRGRTASFLGRRESAGVRHQRKQPSTQRDKSNMNQDYRSGNALGYRVMMETREVAQDEKAASQASVERAFAGKREKLQNKKSAKKKHSDKLQRRGNGIQRSPNLSGVDPFPAK